MVLPFLVVAAAVVLLLLLIVVLKFNAFLALLLVAIGTGLAIGMEPAAVLASVQDGVGSTLAGLALILGLGAMLGGLVADSGAATTITRRMRALFGDRYLSWGMMVTGLLIGIPLFYTVGFVMVVPLIFTVARQTGLSYLHVGLPMVAALSVTHGFLPPHPAPVTVAGIYGADLQLVLLYGLLLAVPTIVLAGPVLARFFRRPLGHPPPELVAADPVPDEALPPLGTSIAVALSPVLLMALAGLTTWLPAHPLSAVLAFAGQPVMALLLAVMLGVFTLGRRRYPTLRETMESLLPPVRGVAMIMLIIAGGGAFKQVLIDSRISEQVITVLSGTAWSPLLLAWTIAAVLRIVLGSATVAGMTAAGIALPLIGQTGASPELLVLATGAGSLTCSHVNDTGFWLFKEYFGLTVGQTLRSWTLMETIVSVVGLAGCLLLEQVL